MNVKKTEQARVRLLAVLLMLATLCAALLCACTPGEVDDSGHATVVIAVGEDIREYDVPLDSVKGELGAIAILDYLKGEGKIDYKSEDAGYGPYLTKVGHLSEDAANGVYVGIWTSVTADQDLESEYATTVSYNGEELVSAAVGMGQLSVEDGCIIYFGELRY